MRHLSLMASKHEESGQYEAVSVMTPVSINLQVKPLQLYREKISSLTVQLSPHISHDVSNYSNKDTTTLLLQVLR